MQDPSQSSIRFSLALKLVVCYFLFVGILGLIWPALGLGPHYASFDAQTSSYKAGAHFAQTAIATGFILAALAIAYRLPWGSRLAYLVLVITAFSSAKEFAWGFAGGAPSQAVYLSSLAASLVWHGILAGVIYRNRRLCSSTSALA
jgi:hypothetical protein